MATLPLREKREEKLESLTSASADMIARLGMGRSCGCDVGDLYGTTRLKESYALFVREYVFLPRTRSEKVDLSRDADDEGRVNASADCEAKFCRRV